jgi:hypothetical protein
MWDRKEIPKTTFEIAVKSGELAPQEKKNVLNNE